VVPGGGHSKGVVPLPEARFAALGPWPAGTRVGLACSGGADSTFLALAWKEWAEGKDLASRALVVDHGHRPDSRKDAETAAALYGDLGFSVTLLTAEADGESENALREARYRALGEACKEGGESVLMTAHHADDLAETVLLRIFRGTGLRGLAGIPERRALGAGVEVRRPLLGLRRAALREALAARGQAWVDDPSNSDPKISARNRLRLLMPKLGELGSADPVVAVLRLAEETRDWEASVVGLLADSSPWADLPSWLRKRGVEDELRALGETASPARLRDLEGSLRRKGSAAVDEKTLLTVAGGRLHSRPRA